MLRLCLGCVDINTLVLAHVWRRVDRPYWTVGDVREVQPFDQTLIVTTPSFRKKLSISSPRAAPKHTRADGYVHTYGGRLSHSHRAVRPVSRHACMHAWPAPGPAPLNVNANERWGLINRPTHIAHGYRRGRRDRWGPPGTAGRGPAGTRGDQRGDPRRWGPTSQRPTAGTTPRGR